MIDNFFDFLTLTPNIPINSLHLKNVVRIAYILNIILSYLLFFLLFVLIENRLSDNNIWQWLITFRGKGIKSITIRFFHVLQNTRNSYETSSHRKSTHIYTYIYITIKQITSQTLHRSNIIPLYFEFHSIQTRKYNTYNAKPDKTNYHKFYRASFKKKKKKIPFLQNPDIPSRISTVHVQNSLRNVIPSRELGRNTGPILFRPGSKFTFILFETHPPLSLSLSLDTSRFVTDLISD